MYQALAAISPLYFVSPKYTYFLFSKGLLERSRINSEEPVSTDNTAVARQFDSTRLAARSKEAITTARGTHGPSYNVWQRVILSTSRSSTSVGRDSPPEPFRFEVVMLLSALLLLVLLVLVLVLLRPKQPTFV